MKQIKTVWTNGGVKCARYFTDAPESAKVSVLKECPVTEQDVKEAEHYDDKFYQVEWDAP